MSNTKQYIADIFLPIMDHCRNEFIILHNRLGHLLNLFEALELILITVIDEVDFFFINETLNTFVDRLFVWPKVQRYFMLWTDHRALSSRSHQLLVFFISSCHWCLRRYQVIYRVNQLIILGLLLTILRICQIVPLRLTSGSHWCLSLSWRLTDGRFTCRSLGRALGRRFTSRGRFRCLLIVLFCHRT